MRRLTRPGLFSLAKVCLRKSVCCYLLTTGLRLTGCTCGILL
uniref:1-acyl-sn-glycerol-3-phosphate acyltransferase 4 n=1 Tax=Arundo donax TaxID=35708 RepID=A0A0A9G504_ARUDO